MSVRLVTPLALTLATLTGACGTRVVDLVVPDAGNNMDLSGSGMPPVQKCETVMRADGSACQICYSVEGMVVGSSCPAPTVDGGPVSPNEPQMCKSLPAGDTRCLLCFTPGGTTMPCLKCDPPVKTSDMGDFCRACGWSDGMGRCLQCFAVDGTVTHDDCDMIRTPAAAPPAGMTPDAEVMTPPPKP